MMFKDCIEEAKEALRKIEHEAGRLVEVQEKLLFDRPNEKEMDIYKQVSDIHKNIKACL